MKRAAGLILMIAILLVLSWMITPQAAADKSKKRESKSVVKVKSEKKPKAFGDGIADVFRSTATADVDEADEDPDLPARQHGNLDKATYLRLRDEYIARRRGVEPGWPFDPTARTRAIQQMEEQEAQRLPDDSWAGKLKSLFGLVPEAGGTWTAIGPAPVPNGSAQGGGNIAVTGRATAIAVDPTNASKVYLGTAQGGVWRSLDGGATWTNIFDSAQSLAIGAIAVAP